MNSPTSTVEIDDITDLELAQALAVRLAIKPNDWHRLNRDRRVRAREQIAAALVYLLKDEPEEALIRLEQAVGWLDRTLTAPPCPTHGEKRASID
jgi:Tfp pilus assembly protein PilF